VRSGRVRTNGAEAYGQIAWSWLSLLQSSLAEVRGAQPGKAHRQFARTREAKGKVGSRESAPYAVKHRAGKAGRSGFTCHPLCIACAFSSHDGQAGASRRPAFPAPFRYKGVKRTAKLGRNKPRGGEGMSASQNHRQRRVGKAQACPRVSCPGRSAAAPAMRSIVRAGALQSWGRCRRMPCRFWVPALRSSVRTLQRVRDTRAARPHECGEIASSRQKNPLSTMLLRALMNRPRLVHKRRPVAGGSPPRCVLG